MTSKRSLLFSALLVLALAGGTTACGGGSNDKKAGDNPSASSTSPGSSGSSGAGGGSGNGSGDGSGGSVDFKITKDVPSDFPKTDVPMIDGKVLNATQGAFTPAGEQVKGWTVRLSYGKSATQALTEAGTKLASAGFTREKKNVGSDERAFKDSTYDVRVRAAKAKGGAVVIYTVIPS